MISTCLTDRGLDELKDTVDIVIKCDVTKDEDVQALHSKCQQFLDQTGKKLWAVVNNAGIVYLGCLDWMSVRDVIQIMDVNYFGLVRVIKALLPFLKLSRHSRIINISSVAGLLACSYLSAYCASKHAVEGLTKVLRTELRPWNIHVANINPSFTR